MLRRPEIIWAAQQRGPTEKFNARDSRRHSNGRHPRRLFCRMTLRPRRMWRTWKISSRFWPSHNAGISSPSNPTSGQEFRNRVRTVRNGIRRSAWGKNNRRGKNLKARVFRDAANGRGSSGSRRCRWCLQKEISMSAIRRGRRKTPRWHVFDDGKLHSNF